MPPLAAAEKLSSGVSLDLDPAAHVLTERQDVIVRQRIVHELALAPTPHEGGVVQRLQVLRQRPLQQPRHVDELGDRAFAGLERVEDSEPRGIGQHAKPPRDHSEQLGGRGRLRAGRRVRARGHAHNLIGLT